MRCFIDVHAHIGETINRAPTCGQTAEKYLARMADSHVVAAVLSPAAGGPQARGVLDTRAQNIAVAEACRRYPRNFPLGLAIVEVRHQEAGVEELARAMDQDGLAGFMCHPGISGHAMGAELASYLEVVNERDGLVLLHAMGKGSEQRIADHARRFTRTTFIAAHVSMTAEQHRASIETSAGLPNVWADFAQHPTTADASWDIADLVRGFGAERLLFGGDSPYYDYRILQGQIDSADIDETAKHGIASQNAVDLIARFAPDWKPPVEPPARPDQYQNTDLWVTLPGQPTRLR